MASLWDLPADIQATDYGICCDVMEHIPTEFVDKTLESIADLTKKAVYFQIALFHDNTFTHAGPLHLSVFPHEWWAEKLNGYFSKCEFETHKGAHTLAVCYA